MRFSHFIFSLLLLALVITVNLSWDVTGADKFGGLTWLGCSSAAFFLLGLGFITALGDVARSFSFFSRRDAKANPLDKVRVLLPEELAELGIKKYRGPDFPHPVIFADRCIGCQACVDACPHDVLKIVDGRAAVVAADQCMEDTACQVECPVNPKACIVINTAKTIRARPAPTRDGATYMTNVPNCYIIGDVSGVPLIKNAVKEGAEVIEQISSQLKNMPPEPQAEYDVAIIGIGPAGASAATRAHELGLRYAAVEQTQILSTIAAYPKGKYIFFKPDTKDWSGGLSVAGLGLTKAKYAAEDGAETAGAMNETLKNQISGIAREQTKILRAEMSKKIPVSLHGDFLPLLEAKGYKEIFKLFTQYLSEKSGAGSFGVLTTDMWSELFRKHWTNLDAAAQETILSTVRRDIVQTLSGKIPGDQRENILAVWLGGMVEKGVKINESENCTSVVRAEDGDYFVVQTEQGDGKIPQTYCARSVVVAIGLRGSPNKLRLKNEDLKIEFDGAAQNKVIYSLNNPSEFRGRHLTIVGGGNSAVEAAVDLVSVREGSNIVPRAAENMNKVTLLVRESLAGNVKFGNKLQLYHCLDNGWLDVKFGAGIKEMRDRELVLVNVKGNREIGAIPNDFVFALIGGERPDRFLQSIGITISG